MAATAEVRARIDEDLKFRANEALTQMGLSMSDAIRLDAAIEDSLKELGYGE